MLVIDDEPLVAATVEAVLEDEFLVTTVHSGNAAIQLIEQDPAFDVVVCDLLMPGFSGIDLYEWMEEEQGALCDKTVFMKGGAFTEQARNFLGHFAERSIEKPLDARLLRSMVRRAVKQAEPGTRRMLG